MNSTVNQVVSGLIKNGLAKDVTGAMTAEEVITGAGLDWTVSKRPVLFQGAAQKVMDGKYVVARDDNDGGLGVVGDNYRPLQNREAFSFFDAVVQEKMAIYRAAGAFEGGRKTWILAQIPGDLRVKTDEMQSFVLLRNSHDGSSAVRLSSIVYRVVCSNVMVALDEGASFVFRHTRNMGEKVAQAREAVGILNWSVETLLAQANVLANKKATTKLVNALLASIGKELIFEDGGKVNDRREDERHEIMRLMESGAGNDAPGVKGTMWAAVNGITEWVDHVWKRRSEENRAMSNWFGDGARMKAVAMGTAARLVG